MSAPLPLLLLLHQLYVVDNLLDDLAPVVLVPLFLLPPSLAVLQVQEGRRIGDILVVVSSLLVLQGDSPQLVTVVILVIVELSPVSAAFSQVLGRQGDTTVRAGTEAGAAGAEVAGGGGAAGAAKTCGGAESGGGAEACKGAEGGGAAEADGRAEDGAEAGAERALPHHH